MFAVQGRIHAAHVHANQPAAPPVENVTVNGQSAPDQEIQAFVESRVAPTFRLGKVAQWKKGICPTVLGLKSDLTDFVANRMQDIAVEVGAPVNTDPHCEHDIQIVFTTTPQALLDDIREHYDALLGYHETESQAQAMANVTHPIQAWYSTVTLDLKETPHFDGSKIDNNACLDFPPAISKLATAVALFAGLHDLRSSPFIQHWLMARWLCACSWPSGQVSQSFFIRRRAARPSGACPTG